MIHTRCEVASYQEQGGRDETGDVPGEVRV